VRAPRTIAQGIWRLLDHVNSGTIVDVRNWI
jgi:hypothetical protein